MKAKTVAPPSFPQTLAALITEVMYGKAHFQITRMLKGTHPAIVKTAPTFFGLAVGAHADSTTLHIARIFDRRPQGTSIYTLLALALKKAGTFKNATAMEVRNAVDEAKRVVTELEPMLVPVRTRRNETLAHVSERAFVDSESYFRDGQISYRRLTEILDKTGAVLNQLFYLHSGTTVPLDLAGVNDVENLLKIVLESLRGMAKRPPVRWAVGLYNRCTEPVRPCPINANGRRLLLLRWCR